MAFSLTARERRRLSQAHETGYLDATCRDNAAIVKAYGLWCWRMKLPMVWFERATPRSRFGRLRLDLLTTPQMLTVAGQAALKSLDPAAVSAHDALWEPVPLERLEKLAHAVFRLAVDGRNHRIDRQPPARIDSQRATELKLVPRQIA